MSRLIYIPFDHLHRNFGALREAKVKEDVIAFVESARMTSGRAKEVLTGLDKGEI